jgi:hypothetical protein
VTTLGKSLPWLHVAAYDLAVVLTAHPEFDPARLVLDARNATGALGALPHVIRL